MTGDGPAGDVDEVEIRRWFPARQESIPHARRWVVEVAEATGHTPLAPTVQLLVSELATNALKYADGGGFVIEFDSDHKIVVAVCDSSQDLPHTWTATDTDTGGRGLELVDKLADQWGVAVRQRGKCVWFELQDPHAD